jgi:tryptophan-rich sensory protein
LNAVWSAIFFGLRSPRLALAEIILLWAAILASTISFWRISAFSGALLVPYLAWVTYGTYLNAGIWRLNRAHSDSSPQFPPGPRGKG